MGLVVCSLEGLTHTSCSGSFCLTYTLNPKPWTLSLKPQILNPKTEKGDRDWVAERLLSVKVTDSARQNGHGYLAIFLCVLASTVQGSSIDLNMILALLQAPHPKP